MPLPDGFDVQEFLKELDKTRDYVGVRVVYFDGATMSELRVGPPMCETGLLAVVIRTGGKGAIPTQAEIAEARDKRFNAELLNLGLSCGGAIISWIVAASATGAAPFTGGSSLIVTNLSATAGWLGAVSCVNAGYRLYNAKYDSGQNDWLDNQWWYTSASTAIDAISLAGAGVSAAAIIRMVKIAKVSTGKSIVEILKGLSRQERRKLTQEVLRMQNPGADIAELEAMAQRGIFPKRFSNADISRDAKKQLLDAVGAVAGFTGSATGGIISKAIPKGPPGELSFGVVNAFETM